MFGKQTKKIVDVEKKLCESDMLQKTKRIQANSTPGNWCTTSKYGVL